ncbi:adenine deaminase [Aliifodinibius salipaludis]|uniref:Adenine deaminase n=1 Tax=Fodinibius salipaludis TaxID=2032627 RepID=A0A2A2GCR0_9BACT|nr:adenine deaminase [Aliifodinibius salipaludis]PAU94572.1 adenine deaminase [Aliifodinibius salipaludis]
MEKIRGIVLDVINHRRFNGEVELKEGVINVVREVDGEVPEQYIMPGFVDSHIHIESSMLVPSAFARLAVRHGTVATVSDPHEIANVCGKDGVNFMIKNGKKVPFKFYFGAPSCVPATPFETAGSELDTEAVSELLDRDDILYLAEMMNWPGVLNGDKEVQSKISAALDRGKPVDGHAPGLKGEKAAQYAEAGITTDHECYTKEEALDKLKHGMKIAIREGSAAKNYDALISLLDDYAGKIMFCSDDKHPDDLVVGHINELVARTLDQGHDLFDTLEACCVTPVQHYGLDVGLLREGDPADFIVVDDPDSMHVRQTWINGHCVLNGETVHIPDVDVKPINNFVSNTCTPDDFMIEAGQDDQYPVIVAQDGQLVTGKSTERLPIQNGKLQTDLSRDILKVAVVNRYEKVPPATAFIKNFGIREGAIASSVAHDSHNVIVVGSSDEYLSKAVNLVMEHEGGLSAVSADKEEVLPLPIAGLMSDRPGEEVAAHYEKLSRMAREMGSELNSPFMLISFMALLVIPSLKISDKGLFDADNFEFVE